MSERDCIVTKVKSDLNSSWEDLYCIYHGPHAVCMCMRCSRVGKWFMCHKGLHPQVVPTGSGPL